MKMGMEIRKPQIDRDIETDNCFDFLRFFLALSVFFSHYDVLHGSSLLNYPIPSPRSVGAFFVISGLLIYRSYCRSNTLKRYFEKRARRIFPAYLLIVLLSSILFSVFSSLNVREYYTSPELFKYLLANLSTMNFLHPSLPGVLDGEAVNPSLWTIKVELFLYLMVPVLSFFFLEKHRWFSLVIVALCSLTAVCLSRAADVTGVASYDLVGKWISLAAYFMVGVSLFLYREEVGRMKCFLLLPALVFSVMDGYVAEAFRPFAIGALVYFAAFTLPFLNKFGRIGDLSYGIYIFHAPIINLTICMGWGVNLGAFATTLLLVLFVAFLSWHLLEKKILSR